MFDTLLTEQESVHPGTFHAILLDPFPGSNRHIRTITTGVHRDVLNSSISVDYSVAKRDEKGPVFLEEITGRH